MSIARRNWELAALEEFAAKDALNEAGRALLAELRAKDTGPTDTEMLDWLENEVDREMKGEASGRSLFRRNQPITREAIRGAMNTHALFMKSWNEHKKAKEAK